MTELFYKGDLVQLTAYEVLDSGFIVTTIHYGAVINQNLEKKSLFIRASNILINSFDMNRIERLRPNRW
jgi:hypothetical protein